VVLNEAPSDDQLTGLCNRLGTAWTFQVIRNPPGARYWYAIAVLSRAPNELEDPFSLPDVAASLRAYERERHRRTAWIVRFSWRLGAVAQWRAPLACALRDASLALTPGWALRLQHRRVVGHRV
jgi:hypothetical protein